MEPFNNVATRSVQLGNEVFFPNDVSIELFSSGSVGIFDDVIFG